VAVGEDLREAYQNAYNAETGIEIHHLALQTGESVSLLTKEQIEEILQRYTMYREKE
jgi:hypothetical protein